MDIKVLPGCLAGEVQGITSKSAAHRLMICAALGEKGSTLGIKNPSEDILATAKGLEALGARIRWMEEGVCSIDPIPGASKEMEYANGGPEISPWEKKTVPLVDCGESGSTLRFLLPVAAALYEEVSFTGRGRLARRPLQELMTQMEEHGCTFSNPSLPFTLRGKMPGGDFHLPGNVSSQYITGLLLAAPLLEEGMRIHLASPLESAPYVDMTLLAMEKFGVKAEAEEKIWRVSPGQRYSSITDYFVEGDWSNAAFWFCSGALGSQVILRGLDKNSAQGDKEVLSILENFGAKVIWRGERVQVQSAPLRGTQVDLRSVPDLLPALAVVAAFAQGETRFYNGARLRLKESDRLTAVKELILSLGGIAWEKEDQLTVVGTGLVGGRADSFGDHRIAMAAAIAALSSREGVLIQGAQAVHKSYSDFFGELEALGGRIQTL